MYIYRCICIYIHIHLDLHLHLCTPYRINSARRDVLGNEVTPFFARLSSAKAALGGDAAKWADVPTPEGLSEMKRRQFEQAKDPTTTIYVYIYIYIYICVYI